MPKRYGKRNQRAFKAIFSPLGVCTCGKVAYSRSRAAKAMKRLVQKNQHDPLHTWPLNIYECPTSPGIWHAGHTPGRLRAD